MSESSHAHAIHRDDFGARLGMWLFLVTEMVLFGGLFIAYSYMRSKYPAEFHHAGAELNATLGITNTLVLLTSSLTVVLAIVAIQRGDRRKTMAFLATTLGLGLVFLVIKSFEWATKFHHGLYPNSAHLATLPHGEQVFFGLYFTMTGLHGLHVIAGLSVLGYMLRMVAKGEITQDRYVHLENGGLYWHLVDVIWIFLLPLFYLAA
ncbi:cytochrome oxidase subunit III [Geothrix rubra]|uniref:Cytochrome oxidase subunit III n=1 Tax=Geothrix rubra TaxID=2927977 RepID=A0ABQ5Q9B2_9BACT|nr:cytochrome c oxidase subunit 3 family protein [Geothrix rubra]GLH70634.1 cytochrome oxidase subunit III [Geothrix rubra]